MCSEPGLSGKRCHKQFYPTEIIRPDQGECYRHQMVIKFSAE